MSKVETAIDLLSNLPEKPTSKAAAALLSQNDIALNFNEARTVDRFLCNCSGGFWMEAYKHPKVGDILPSHYGDLLVESTGFFTFAATIMAN